MKWNVDDLPIFLAVHDKQSISAAARHLSMPKSSVSRILNRLEEHLDVRLFDRNTRQMRLTAEGEIFAMHATSILDQVHLADATLSGMRHAPSGVLKVSLPMAFSREIIGGRLAEFSENYPNITLQISVGAQPVNLLREDLDLAFMVGPIEDSELVGQQVSDTPLIWVASASYADQLDLKPKLAELRPHLRFCERRYQTDRLPIRTPSGKQFLDTSNLMSVNDPVILRDIALQGGGVALLPRIYCEKHMAKGALVQLCAPLIPEARATIYAVTASRRLQPQKAHVFIEFVRACVASYQKQA